MAKRSQKLFRQWRKKNTGCMRGLISLFDFRQGRPSQRLLSNKRHGGVSNLGINACNKVDDPCNLEKNHGDNQSDTESDEAFVDSPRVSSISTLMEKEMWSAHRSREEFSSEEKSIKAELGTGPISEKDDKVETMSAATLTDKNLNASLKLISQQSDQPDRSSELDFSTFMLDYCSNFIECEKTPLEYKIKKNKTYNSQQNQLLGDLGTKMIQKQKNHFIFRKKEKSTTVYRSNESDDADGLDRIVVLKPTHFGNQNLSSRIAPKDSVSSPCSLQNIEDREQISSHFSLREIRKRFKNVIGSGRKEEHPIAKDGLLHKIPYGKQISSEVENGEGKRLDSTSYKEKDEFSVTPEAIASRKLNQNSSPRALYTEASFCNEARNHLADFVRCRSESESLPPIHVSKSLGRFLSFPGFNYLSPRQSPAREKDQVFQENRSLLLHQPIERKDSDPSDIFVREGFADNKPESINEMMENVEIEEVEEVGQVEAICSLTNNEDDFASKIVKEGGSSFELESEQSNAMFESSAPSTPKTSKFSEIQESNGIECSMDEADRPSPISVLEPLCFEEINIPRSTLWRIKAIDPMMQTRSRESQTDTELDSVSCTEFDEALLFDELEVSYSMRIHDPKLLFDFIDEVLSEIKERHFSLASQLTFGKKSIVPMHRHEYFVTEASRRIDWHLDVQFPNTLEQLVEKDLEGTVWIGLQFGAEITVDEIEDSILDFLFEETALELWD